MCGGGWYARHAANHHNHRGGQHHSETQAEEKSCRKKQVAEIAIFRTEDYLGVILLILEPIVSITLLPQQIIPFQKRSENLKR